MLVVTIIFYLLVLFSIRIIPEKSVIVKNGGY